MHVAGTSCVRGEDGSVANFEGPGMGHRPVAVYESFVGARCRKVRHFVVMLHLASLPVLHLTGAVVLAVFAFGFGFSVAFSVSVGCFTVPVYVCAARSLAMLTYRTFHISTPEPELETESASRVRRPTFEPQMLWRGPTLQA